MTYFYHFHGLLYFRKSFYFITSEKIKPKKFSILIYFKTFHYLYIHLVWFINIRRQQERNDFPFSFTSLYTLMHSPIPRFQNQKTQNHHQRRPAGELLGPPPFRIPSVSSIILPKRESSRASLACRRQSLAEATEICVSAIRRALLQTFSLLRCTVSKLTGSLCNRGPGAVKEVGPMS